MHPIPNFQGGRIRIIHLLQACDLRVQTLQLETEGCGSGGSGGSIHSDRCIRYCRIRLDCSTLAVVRHASDSDQPTFS